LTLPLTMMAPDFARARRAASLDPTRALHAS